MYIISCYIIFTIICILEKVKPNNIVDIVIWLLAPITLPLYVIIGLIECILEIIGENK